MPWITTPIVLALSLALAQGAEPRITYLTGNVSVSPDGVRTTGGRAELVLSDGTLVHVDGASTVRVDRSGALSLSEGRLLLRTGDGPPADLDVPYARMRLWPLGVYSVLADAPHGRLLVSVVAGRVDFQGRYSQSTPITAGQLVMMTSATSAVWPTPFQPAGWDGFELWSDSRLSQTAWRVSRASYEAMAANGGVINTYPGSPTCSSWLSLDNPCWLLPLHPSTLPGVPPYRPRPPGYAPNHQPNYTPNYNVPPVATPPSHPPGPSAGRPEGPGPGGGHNPEPPPSARPARPDGRPRPTPAPPSVSPAPKPNPNTRGAGGGIRGPERPSSR